MNRNTMGALTILVNILSIINGIALLLYAYKVSIFAHIGDWFIYCFIGICICVSLFYFYRFVIWKGKKEKNEL